MRYLIGLVTILAAQSVAANAQDSMAGMPGMDRPAPSASPSVPASTATATQPMPGMDMSGGAMTGMAEMGAMKGDLGGYAMSRDASGTSWQPDSSPIEGLHHDFGAWSTMLHGYVTAVYDNQGGPRGGDKAFSESMLMAMAQRPLGGGTLTLRAMGSLDPLMGKSGYPELLQTGETADGKTQLTDRQHPHDLIMELAGVYSHKVAGALSGFVYFGLPGEPALGPATFMHRFSGVVNPEAPITHHWLDSTHITYGVATGGLVYRTFKIEGSSFTGREPDQFRYNIERPRLDSWSVRGTWNPTAELSLQVSHGFLKSPEQLDPNTDQRRTTASTTYNLPLRNGNWQTTFAWGRKVNLPGTTTDAYLLESAVTLGRHTVFGRAENVDKDELFTDQPTSPLHGRTFNVTEVSAGYAYTVTLAKPLAVDLGAMVTRYALPSALDPAYGADPTSFMLFARFKII